jgi:hypothetical protein
LLNVGEIDYSNQLWQRDKNAVSELHGTDLWRNLL